MKEMIEATARGILDWIVGTIVTVLMALGSFALVIIIWVVCMS